MTGLGSAKLQEGSQGHDTEDLKTEQIYMYIHSNDNYGEFPEECTGISSKLRTRLFYSEVTDWNGKNMNMY